MLKHFPGKAEVQQLKIIFPVLPKNLKFSLKLLSEKPGEHHWENCGKL